MKKFGMLMAAGVMACVLLYLTGCAQMDAAWQLGRDNQRLADRVLEYGTDDYQEYIILQKLVCPKWNKVFDEHGEPDYVIPRFGSNCEMVWTEESLTASPTTFGGIEYKASVPSEVCEYQDSKARVRQNEMNRASRKAEDALRENAVAAYRNGLQGNVSSRFRIKSLDYDDSSKAGRIVVVVDDADFVVARMWAKFYIEALAKDKNVALVTGKSTDEGRYLIKSEKISGEELELSFEVLY